MKHGLNVAEYEAKKQKRETVKGREWKNMSNVEKDTINGQVAAANGYGKG